MNANIEQANDYYSHYKTTSKKDGRSGGISMRVVAKMFGIKYEQLRDFRMNHNYRGH